MFGGEYFEIEERLNDLWSIGGSYVKNVDIGCPNNFFTIHMMHSILILLGWGGFLQLGAFIAMYLGFRRRFGFIYIG